MTKHAIAAKSLLKKWIISRPLNMKKKSSPFQKSEKCSNASSNKTSNPLNTIRIHPYRPNAP